MCGGSVLLRSSASLTPGEQPTFKQRTVYCSQINPNVFVCCSDQYAWRTPPSHQCDADNCARTLPMPAPTRPRPRRLCQKPKTVGLAPPAPNRPRWREGKEATQVEIMSTWRRSYAAQSSPPQALPSPPTTKIPDEVSVRAVYPLVRRA